jgi:hypothetical protein
MLSSKSREGISELGEEGFFLVKNPVKPPLSLGRATLDSLQAFKFTQLIPSGEDFMANKNVAVFGIYLTATNAEMGVDRLLAAGYSNEDVSVLMADAYGSREFAHEKNTKAPEGTAAGVSVGGLIGGTLGLLAGIGALAIPGVGPLIAAGPIMGALAGLGAGGAVGGVVGALVGLGIPEYEAKRYEGRVKDGGVLLSVHCDTPGEIQRAKEILKSSGAEDIASTGEKAVGSHGGDQEEERYTPAGTR